MSASGKPTPQLSLFDTTSIIVGIIVGVGIYRSTPLIAANVESPGMLIGVWLFGGLTALVAALCYVELATSFPREGGDYVFLSLAYGKPVGFLFAWAEFWIIRPGNVGMMAFVFAEYAQQIAPLKLTANPGPVEEIVYAAAPILILTGINLLGVRAGKHTQNLLTVLKMVGLAAVAIAAFCLTPAAPPTASEPQTGGSLRLAALLAMFAYGGWNEMANVAAEVRDPQKNIFRALVLGVAAVTGIYVLVNFAFLHSLGLNGVAGSKAVAADVAGIGAGDLGRRFISALVCVSALGAINGMLFTGSRILFAVGNDYGVFQWLGRWSPRFDAPVRAFLAQAAMTLALIVALGWLANGFERLLIFTSPIYWSFALLVAISVFLLRRKTPDVPQPYRTLGYPSGVAPVLFILLCSFLLYSSTSYAYENRSPAALAAFSILAIGVVAGFLSRPIPKKP